MSNIAIIIPFREEPNNTTNVRAEQLKQITKFMYDNLKDYVKLFIIEQSADDRLFNRGKLLNCGYELAKKEGYTNLIFHDVDLLPSKELLKYYKKSISDGTILHLAYPWKRYQYEKYVGGITYITSNDFEKINGFPNNFWGWGGEDDELYNRLKTNNIKIKHVSDGNIQDLEDLDFEQKNKYLKSNNLKNMVKYELLKEHKTTWKFNGLNNLSYNIISTIDDTKNNSIHIVIDINMSYNKTIPNSKKTIWDRTDLQVNKTLQDIYKQGKVQDQKNVEKKFHSGINPIEGYHLYNLVKMNKCQNIIEVGMAYGTSALYICEALKENGSSGLLTSIDPNQKEEWENIGISNVQRAGLSKFHKLIEETSHRALPNLLCKLETQKIKPFDMIFIDGMHLFDYTLVDIFFATKLLKIDGILVVDDIKHMGVKPAINYVKTNYGNIFKYIPDDTANQTMATFIKTGIDSRPWNFHKKF